MEQKLDYGRIGEKAAELELLKHGIEVINLTVQTPNTTSRILKIKKN